MTVQVRVMAAQAQRELSQVDAQLRRTAATAQMAGARMTGAFNSMGNSLVKWGSQVQWAGRQMQYNFTIPLSIAAGAATKFALDNERAMVRVVKVYGDTEHGAEELKDEIDALGGAFEALSNHFGVNRAEVIKVAGDWAAAGSSGLALAKVTRLTLETMILGEIEAAAATEALIAIQAQYGFSVDQLTKAINVLNMTENETGITMQGLIQGMARSAGVARSAGIDVEHLAAMMAALVPAAGSATQAGNGLRTMISRLLAPTNDAAELMALMGHNVNDLGWQSLTGTQRIELMARSFEELADSQKMQISSYVASRWQINRFNVLMRDVVNENGYYQRSLNATADAQANFNQRQFELNAVLSSNPQRLKQMWTIMQNALANVIQPLVPWIVYLAQEVAGLFTRFSQLDPAIQKLVLGGLAFVAAFGMVARYVGVTAVLFGFLVKVVTHALMPFAALGKGMIGLAAIITGRMMAAFTALGRGLMVVSTMFSVGMRALIGVTTKGIALMVAVFQKMLPFIAAIVGPTMRTLSTIFVSGFALIGRNMAVIWTATWTAMGSIVRVGTASLWVLWSVLIKGMMVSTRMLFVNLGAMFAAGWKAIAAMTARALTTIKLLFVGFAASFKGIGILLVSGINKAIFAIFALFTRLPALLAAAGRLLLVALTSPWTIAIVAVIGLLAAFGDDIARWWQGVVDSFRNNASGIANAFRPVVDFFRAAVQAIHNAFNSLPQGVQNAVMAVVEFVKAAAMKVYEWFSYLNPFARHSPSLVESVTNGMAVIARQYKSVSNVGAIFAKAAADLEAYKKLAASLNWDEWSEERADVAALMPAGLDLFNQLVADLKPLNALLREQGDLVDAQEKVVYGWKTQLNAANAALDEQEYLLGNLKAQLDAIQDAYDAHRDAMQAFADAGITGQRAMSDAIFENEMAQKRLRLEIMRLEDSGESVDDLRARMAALQGDIEFLRGEANDLRAAGAGSDVLGGIEAQIDAMEAAYEAMGNTTSPINELQRQLEELQRQGEILDLENSINFDPLERQIDQLVDGMNELPFDEIIAGIQTERAAMDALKPSLDAATQAYNAQKAVTDQYRAARDALQRSYDLESNKLQYLRDEYQMTADAIGDIEEALRMVSGAAERAGGAMGGVGRAGRSLVPSADFPDPGGLSSIGREGSWDSQAEEIRKWTEELTAETAGALAEFDMFGPIREKWDSFVAWWNANAVPAWRGLMDGLGEIGGTLAEGMNLEGIGNWFSDVWAGVQEFWGNIQPFMQDLGELFGPQLQEIWDRLQTAIGPAVQVIIDELSKWGDTLGGLWEILKPFVMWVGGVLVAVLSEAFTIVGNVIGPVVEFIGDAIANILQFIRGLIDFVAGVFTGDWSRAWDGIVTAFGAVWSFIVHTLEAAWEIIYGIVAGIVEGIVDFFQFLWDLVDEKVGGMISGIIEWFQNLWTSISTWFSNLWTNITTWLNNIWTSWSNWVISVYNTVTTWFGNIWQSIADWFSGLWENIKGWFENLWMEYVLWCQSIYDTVSEWFANIWTTISEWFGGLWEDLKGWFENLWMEYVLWCQSVYDTVGEWFTNIYNTIREKVEAVWTAITTKLSEIWTNIKTWGQNIWTSIRDTWENVRSTIWNKIVEIVTNVRSKFQEVIDTVWEKINTVKDNVTTVFTTVRDTIMGAFEYVRDKISGVFTSITNFIKSGINVGIRAVNGLIDGLNKVADILPGLDWTISPIPLLAKGGVVPGRQVGGGFVANQARAIVGEGNSNYPEFVIPTDPRYRDRALELFNELAGQIGMGTDNPALGIGGWGFLGDIADAVGDAIGNGADLLREGVEWVGDAARGAASKVFQPFKDMAQRTIDGMSWQMGKEWASAGLNNIWNWVTGADEAYKKAGEQAGGVWRKPLNTYTISSGYGMRTHPITGVRTMHTGLDMAAPQGTGIYAAGLGSLVRGTSSALGKYMTITHGNGVKSIYGHMSAFVKANGQVAPGQLIGRVGSTGNSTGPHLHFELRKGGSTLDPRAYMSSLGVALQNGGIVRRQAGGILANIGEGRYDEAVVPLPPGWQNMGSKLATMTVQRLAVLGSIEGRTETLQPTTHITNNTVNIYGDLVLPNITSGEDADDFIRNLHDLAGGR